MEQAGASPRGQYGPMRRPSTFQGLLAAAALLAGVAAAGGCGGQSSASAGGSDVTASTPRSSPAASTRTTGRTATAAGTGTAAVTPAPATRPRPPAAPVVALPGAVGSSWSVLATLDGRPAAWIAQRSGLTLMRFDQHLVRLALHSGSQEPGGSGWRYGDRIGPMEIHHVIAGFNGGFKLSYGSVGFFANGRTAVRLSAGLGSIVTYADGSTQIGAWHEGVPQRGKPIASVRQNLRLLVDHGRAAATVEGCVTECWGQTIGHGTIVARSALGIDAQGDLVWAAGETLSPADLANGLLAAGVQRAVELDINPFWVAGYVYEHHPGGPSAVPVVPGQHGIAGELLEADPRDFFTVLAR